MGHSRKRMERMYSAEEAARNVELWHGISGADETRRRMAHDAKAAEAWRGIEANCSAIRADATGRGSRWSWTYQARNAAARAAYYEARVATAKELLA